MAEREFLVYYDYGMGAVWFWLAAGSEAEVLASYPELDIAHRIPEWITSGEAADLPRYSLSDPPQGFLSTLLESRDRQRRLEGVHRPVFTVGTQEDGAWRWTFLRATDEGRILSKYPELTIRHGRDPEWAKARVRDGSFDTTVYDIDLLAGDRRFLDAVADFNN